MVLLADTRPEVHSLPCIHSQGLHCCSCVFPDYCLPTASLLDTFHPNFYQVSLYQTKVLKTRDQNLLGAAFKNPPQV